MVRSGPSTAGGRSTSPPGIPGWLFSAKTFAAKLNLARTEVRAPINGAVTNFGLRPGTYARSGSPVVTLVDVESFHVDGYFEETRLQRIAVGDRATVRITGVRR